MYGRGAAALCAAIAGMTLSAGAWAACPDDAAVEALAARMLAGTASEPPTVETMADGLCAQDKLVAILEREWGAPVGYKAGLTNRTVQRHFGVDEPVRGVLLADMMLEDGARVPADFAALARFEADLVVVVADAGINDATTPAEVLAHLSAVHPFIELPSLVVADQSKMSAPVIAAINVGARYGVLGAAIPVERTDAFLDALAAMQVTAADQDGAELSSASGSAVLGHPLNAVLWLRDSGVVLAPGDLVSVGSIGPLLPPEKGLTAVVRYRGLPGDPSVRVTFE